MLVLTYSQKGNAVSIGFDEAGRRQLLALLEEIQQPGDHVHLMVGSGPLYGLEIGKTIFDEVPVDEAQIGWFNY